MCRVIDHIVIAMFCIMLAGCSKREQVGGGYVLVTPPTMGPDHHPGVSLQRKGKVVWDNVYVGHFSPHAASKFCHNGMFVFVGPVPGNTDWWIHSQLFGVRSAGPPVVLSERLLGKRLVVSSDMHEMSSFAVRDISLIEGGVRVVFELGADDSTQTTKTNDLAWTDIKGLLDDADASAKMVRHRLGDYRVLALQTNLPSSEL